MASTDTPQRSLTKYGAYRKPAKGAGSWETFSWYFFRVTGVALVFLALIHLFINHVQNDVSATQYQLVAERYANPFWRVYDLLLLTFALFHGLNGLRIVCEDYITSRGWRLTVTSTLFIISIAFWLTGSMTILTFQPGHTITQAILGLFGGH